MRTVMSVLVVVALTGIGAPNAHAEDASQLSAAERIDRAKAHFDRGQALFTRAQYAAAALEFEAAYELQPLALLLWNAAQAYRKAGDNARAIDAYKRYLDADPTTKKRAEVEKIVADLDFQQKVATARPPTEPPAPPQPQAGDTERPPFSELAQQQARADRAARRRPQRPWWKDPLAPALLGSGVALVAVGGGLWGAANGVIGAADVDYENFEAAHGVGNQRLAGVVLLSVGAAAAVAGAARYIVVWQREKDRGELRPRGGAGARASW
jgi:tetratricopeptide (TPR) repeat protein